MKTSEFIKKVEELGYRVKCNNDFVMVDYGANVSRKLEGYVNLTTNCIELAKLAIEYAETPIHEREEEKKYIVIIPDPESEVSRAALARTVNGKIVINGANASSIESLERYHLTEAEIKRNHEYLWQFAKEVEE